MIVAITIWDDRISPVCDSASTLLLVETRGADIIRKQFVPFPRDAPVFQLETLKTYQVTALICGAITERLASMVERNGVVVESFITGKVDDVLQAYLYGSQRMDAFCMPGAGQCRNRGMKKRYQKGPGRRYHNNSMR